MFRRGSGVYVRERAGSAPEVPKLGLESLEEAVSGLVVLRTVLASTAKS